MDLTVWVDTETRVGDFTANWIIVVPDTRSLGVEIQETIGSLVCSTFSDCLCSLVVRVPGYRSRGPEFDSRRYHIF
jgi:hypothetical protein